MTVHLGPKILNVGLAADTDHSDPALAFHVVSAQFLYATQARLLNYEDEPATAGTTLYPEVAADWPEVSPDGLTYTFRIRSGRDAYRYQTGAAVLPSHFAYALNRLLRPEMDSPAVAFFGDIAGADDVIGGRRQEAEGIEYSDEAGTLRISLVTKAPDFLHRIATSFAAPLPPSVPVAETDLVPTAGPYYLAERVPGRSMRLARNPHYSHSRPAGVEEIRYRIGLVFTKAIEMIERGDLDYVADGIEPELESYLGDVYGVNTGQYMMRPSLQLDYLALNCSRPLFTRSAVRRAFNHAVDRPAILAARGAHAGVLTNHIIPPGMPGYQEFDEYPLLGPDYEKARAMLPRGFSAHQPAVIYTWNALAGPDIGRIVAENLRALGIPSVIRQYSDTEMFWRISRREEPFDIAASGVTADYPDPYVFINSLLDGTSISAENNSNDCYFNDPKFNARMKYAATLEGQARADAYAGLDAEIMSDAAPMVPCDNNTRRDFVGARVSGAFQHGLYSVDLCTIRLEDVPRMVVAGRGESGHGE